MTVIKYLGKWSLMATFFFFSLQSCSIQLISQYDDITDKSVTVLQEKVMKNLVKLERYVGTPEADYDKYKAFYDEAKVDLSSLKIRADAIDKNTIVQQQIVELTKMMGNMEALHKLGFTRTDDIKALEIPFNSAFTAIVKLQLALKRGDKKQS